MIVWNYAPGYLPKISERGWTPAEKQVLLEFAAEATKEGVYPDWAALQGNKFSGLGDTTKRSAKAIQRKYVSCSPSPPSFHFSPLVCFDACARRARSRSGQRLFP